MPLLKFLLFNTLTYLSLAGARVTFSLLALEKLGANEWNVGLIMSLFSVVAVPMAVPMGRLVDRIGVKLPLIAACLTMAGGIGLPCLVPGVGALYAGSVLMGTGWLAAHVSLLKILGMISSPENRLANFNSYSISFAFALLVGPTAAGLLIDAMGHYPTLLVLSGVSVAGMLVMIAGLLALPPAVAEPPRQAGSSALDLLRNAALRPVYIVSALIGSAWELYTFVVPVHGHHLGFSASQIGLILGAYSGATFVIRLVMPAIGRRYSEWQIVRGALFASALGFLLLPLVGMVSVYVAVSFFMGLALGSSLPNVLSLLHVNAPEGRSGEVFGIRVTITNIIQFTVPMMVGACGAAVGLAPVFLAFAAALGAGFGTAHQRVRQGT